MPLNVREAAKSLMESGYTDDEVQSVIGSLKSEFRNLAEQGLSDQDIQARLGQTKFTSKDGKELNLFSQAGGATSQADVSMQKQAVLREQPTRLEEAVSPGGIASPENIGSITGGLTGFVAGAPFGPVGAFGGAILGAGGGAMLGRGAEMIKEAVSGPYSVAGPLALETPNRSITEIIGELGSASQRGMIGQSLGEFGSIALKKFLAPLASRMTDAATAALNKSKDLGIPITPAQIFDSARGARIEGISGRSILGSNRAVAARDLQSSQTADAITKFADDLSPGLSHDFHTVGNAIKAASEGRNEGLRTAVRTLIKQTSGGTSPLTRAEAGAVAKESREQLLDALKGRANRMYEAVRKAAGDAANQVESPNFKTVANEIASKEASLTGVQVSSAKMARGASSQFPKPRLTQLQIIEGALLTGGPVDPSSLPAELVQKFGLDKNKVWTLDALREWQSRLGALAANTENRVARRDFTRAFVAVGKDIEQWGETLAPEAGALLKKANEFYKTKIADVYFNRLVSGIDKAEPDLVANLFLGPNKSAVAMDRVHKAIGEKAWRQAAGSYLDEIMSGANGIDGRFSPTEALRVLDSHSPDVLQRLFGNNFTTEQAVVKMLQRNPTKTIQGIAGASGDKVIDMLVPRQGTVESIGLLRRLLPKDTFDQTAGAIVKKVVERSSDNTGAFSLDRFLTQVNSRTGYSQPQLRALFGENYGEFRQIVDLMARVNANIKIAGNPSGTGQALLSQIQLGGAIMLGADIAGKTFSGKEDFSDVMRQVGTGLAILSPAAIAKLVYTPGGVHWLTEGLKVSPGSAAAVRAIGTLQGLVISDKLGITPQHEGERAREQANIRNDVLHALKSKDVPIEEKMRAMIGGAQVGANPTIFPR